MFLHITPAGCRGYLAMETHVLKILFHSFSADVKGSFLVVGELCATALGEPAG